MVDSKFDKFLEKVIPTSMLIATFKLHLAEILKDQINEIAMNQGVKLHRNNREDIEKVIFDVVSSIPPSYFKIPLDFKPKSESDVLKILNEIDEADIKKILDKIIGELERGQTRL